MSAAGSLFVFTNSTKNYSLAALIRYVEYIQNISFSQGSEFSSFSYITNQKIIIKISQDGNVRFVTWKEGMVTYWDQVATSLLDI